MLDGWARRQVDPLLDGAAARLVALGVTANQLTVASGLLGLAAAGLVAFELYAAGLVLLLVSRLGDGLDGAVARIHGPTEFGGYLDIVLDFAVYGAVPLGFVVADPGANAIAGAVLLLSFYVNGATFLSFSAIAAGRGMTGGARGRKTFFFTAGLAEGTETILFLVAICLFPGHFSLLAFLFAAMCLWTAAWRSVLAAREFRRPPDRA